jgi:hypothetical protein
MVTSYLEVHRMEAQPRTDAKATIDTPFFTYSLLQQLNQRAIAARRNRTLRFDKLPIEKTEWYPVKFHLPHNDGAEVRCELVLNKDAKTAWLDITLDEFLRLPTQRACHYGHIPDIDTYTIPTTDAALGG